MAKGCPDFRSAMRLPRRAILRAGVAGLAGLNLSTLLRGAESPPAARPKAKHVVFLYQFGGPSHIDTFDVKPDAPEAIRGEFRPIATGVPGLRVSEHMPATAKILGEFAQIRTMNHRMANHNPAAYYALTGHAPPIDDIRLRDTQELYPASGSTVSRFRPVADPAIPSFVSLPHRLRDGSVTPGQHASFLGKQHDPFFVGQDPNSAEFRLPELTLPASMGRDRLDDRRNLLRMIDAQGELLATSAAARGIDAFYDRALTMLGSPKVRDAFDLSGEPPTLRDAYGRTTYGQSCLMARRLVESGVRFVTVYYSAEIGGLAGGGWDSHGENFKQLKDRLLPIHDRAVPTLITDLKSRGLLDETLVVWVGEFGRSPKVAATAQFGPNGRDHWPKCYTALLAGGGVTGGAVHGASDKNGAYPASDPTSPDDLAATIYWALGIDPAAEFVDSLGRPLPIAAGRPVSSIFS